MKVAVSCNQGTLDETVDTRFGRCKKFLIINTATGEKEVIDNTQNTNSPGGAGIQAAQNISKAGANAVISGHFGPNAFKTLSAASIEAYTISGTTVLEAIESFRHGKLERLNKADVEGHW